jgi:uncharacterized phage protein (TIGR01671 family)
MKQMKDRYLFKAKTCNGEWVSGFLHCKENKWYISNKAGSPFAFEVRPDTICQCTGLKDKNGKLIWENDIMVAHLDDDYPEDETYIRIMWHGSGFCSKENGSEDIIPIDKFDREHFEVCGNIFDNPDLLEMGV